MTVPPTGPDGVAADEYWRWHRDVFGDSYRVSDDGPDLESLLRTARTGLATVHRMLAAGLRHGDPVVPEALVVLSEHGVAPENAVEMLSGVAPAAHDRLLTRVAQALYWLTGDESWCAPIASVMASAVEWSDRAEAAIALRDFPRMSVLIGALAGAVRDSEYLVRYHAAGALLAYAGDVGDITEHRELFALICADDAPDGWHGAARELAAGAASSEKTQRRDRWIGRTR